MMDSLRDARHIEYQMEQALIDAFGGNEAIMAQTLPFDDWYFDTYDASVELLDAKADFAPTEEQLAALLALGIQSVFVSYGETAVQWYHRDGEWKHGPCSSRTKRDDLSALLQEALSKQESR
jgi:hypothetical protein